MEHSRWGEASGGTDPCTAGEDGLDLGLLDGSVLTCRSGRERCKSFGVNGLRKFSRSPSLPMQ